MWYIARYPVLWYVIVDVYMLMGHVAYCINKLSIYLSIWLIIWGLTGALFAQSTEHEITLLIVSQIEMRPIFFLLFCVDQLQELHMTADDCFNNTIQIQYK